MAAKKKAKKRGSGERAGVSKDDVVAAAVAIVEADGAGALTLARLAAALGIQTPSLYTHVDGLAHVQQLVKGHAAHSLLAAMRDAALGRSGHEALRAVCDAQRSWAKAHAGLSPLTVSVRDDDSDDIKAAAAAVLAVIVAILRGYGLEGDAALHATRVLRAATSGFCMLEQSGGFGMPLSVDDSWRHLVDLLDVGLQRLAAGAQPLTR